MSVQANSYRNVADVLDQLPRLVADTRRIYNLSERQAAAQIGISQPQLHAFETQSRDWRGSTVRAVLAWLDDIYPSDVRVQPPAVAA